MKNCPYCKAEIEDNARFCLYCMQPLNAKSEIAAPRKKSLWWLVVVAAVLLILLASVLLFPDGQTKTGDDSPSAETSLPTESIELESDEDTQIQEGTPPVDNPSAPNQAITNHPQPRPSEPTQTTTNPARPNVPEETTSPTSEPDETTEETTEETIEETTEPQTPQSSAGYIYRAARAGDDFNANYTNSGNDIVITGIAQPSAKGVYDIPAYIDGKKVIAIMPNAFSGSNAQTVYVPTTVKTIWNYAFAGSSLTDIYFRGSAIYAESKAFSGSLTIHCSASCSDRNFRYYKNCAASYGAVWEEWNG